MVKTKENKESKKRVRLTGEDRIIDLLERIGTVDLYLNTDLSQNDIAKRLGMDNNRVSEILKGIKKPVK